MEKEPAAEPPAPETPPGGRGIFVTGATGNTGVRLVRALLERGDRVTCGVRDPDVRNDLPENPKLGIARCDLSDESDNPGLNYAIRGADAVLHLAHVGCSGAVTRAAESAGVSRFIALSSTRRFTRFPDETARRVIAGEGRIEASALAWTILRPTMIYGGGRDNNVERLRAWFRQRRIAPLVRGGRILVQPIHTDDVVTALLSALDHPESTTRRAINIAGPEPISWRAMVEAVARAEGAKPFWIPTPWLPAWWGFRAAEAVRIPLPLRSDQLRRLLEDKNFDITEALAALPGWRPRDFVSGLQSSPDSRGSSAMRSASPRA